MVNHDAELDLVEAAIEAEDWIYAIDCVLQHSKSTERERYVGLSVSQISRSQQLMQRIKDALPNLEPSIASEVRAVCLTISHHLR